MPQDTFSPFVLATAGHIDHGKTQLIKALTGLDTDRLKEEKERGISIELGFAFLTFPDGSMADIIDVPGHERFIHTMVSGVTSIDAAMLIVACDEGIMPQTREHVDILSLLGVENGLVILTKSDLSGQSRRNDVLENLRSYTDKTFFKDKPVIFTSAVTGEGMDELKSILFKLTRSCAREKQDGHFFLPVDRVFTMKGFGTVVTGTLRLGNIHEGDAVEILPQGLKTTARGVQVHKGSVKEALPGQRTAVNLSGVQKESLSRGHVIATPGAYAATQCFDAEIRALPHAQKSLVNRQIFHLHLGTTRSLCRMILLEKEQLQPGESSFAQFLTDAPVVTYQDDRFILRTYSPMLTVAGGKILNARAKKHKRKDAQTLETLQNMRAGNKQALLTAKLKEKNECVPAAQLIKEMGLSAQEWEQIKTNLPVVCLSRELVIHESIFNELSEKILSALSDFHKKHPERQGMRSEELKIKFPSLTTETFSACLLEMQARHGVQAHQSMISLQNFKPSFSTGQSLLMQEIEIRLKNSKFTPPSKSEVVQNDPQREKIVKLLLENKNAVAVGDFLYHAEVMNEIRRCLLEFFKTHKELDVQEAKTLFNITRKHLIPLLEFLDATGFTARAGNKRVLRRKPES